MTAPDGGCQARGAANEASIKRRIARKRMLAVRARRRFTWMLDLTDFIRLFVARDPVHASVGFDLFHKYILYLYLYVEPCCGRRALCHPLRMCRRP